MWLRKHHECFFSRLGHHSFATSNLPTKKLCTQGIMKIQGKTGNSPGCDDTLTDQQEIKKAKKGLLKMQ